MAIRTACTNMTKMRVLLFVLIAAPLSVVFLTLDNSTADAFLFSSTPKTTTPSIITTTKAAAVRRRPLCPYSLAKQQQHCRQRFFVLLQAEASDTSSSSSSSSSSSPSSIPDLRGKTLYQRAFYRFTPNTDASLYNAMVIEERLRFRAKDDDPTTVLPFGPRTLVLRNGQVDDGKIGPEFCTINVQEELHATSHRSGLLTGRKPDAAWISTLATALYIAANANTLGQGRVLQLACDLGLASLLGCIGASFVLQQQEKDDSSSNDDDDDDKVDDDDDMDGILTFSRDKDKLLSKKLKLLALTDIFSENDNDLQRMELVLMNLEHAVGPHGAHQVVVKSLDWTSKQQQRQSRMGRNSSSKSNKPFTTIIASDVATTFPYAKALANTVAHALAPSAPYYFAQDQQRLRSSSPSDKTTEKAAADDDDDLESRILPRFVHIAPEDRGDEVSYLHRFLQQGYKMQVDIGYLKVERIIFALQPVDTSSTGSGMSNKSISSPAQEEALLDDYELEVAEIQEFVLESTTATHDARYAGGGSGEIFFPMETGEYDNQKQNSGSAGPPYMEREWDRK
jgi:hypothetical protein